MNQEPKEPEHEYGRQFSYAYNLVIDPETGNYEESFLDSEGNLEKGQGNIFEDDEE